MKPMNIFMEVREYNEGGLRFLDWSVSYGVLRARFYLTTAFSKEAEAKLNKYAELWGCAGYDTGRYAYVDTEIDAYCVSWHLSELFMFHKLYRETLDGGKKPQLPAGER